MISARRTRFNYALERAVEWAEILRKPLVVLEALRCDYPWASDRLHRFILDGMEDNSRALERRKILYFPYVEPAPGAGRGLLDALARRASVVVTDDFPAFFLPPMVAAAAKRLPVLLEQVDGNGLLPMRATDQVFPTAYAFRRFLQRSLPGHLEDFPEADPLAGARLPSPSRSLLRAIEERWPKASLRPLRAGLSSLPVDHSVGPTHARGGSGAARTALSLFLRDRLPRYAESRNDPEADVASGFSPYLHFGHLSAHEVLAALALHEGWTVRNLSGRATGARSGWWGMSAAAEAFLDQLVTWRELGFNMCAHRDDYDQYVSLPDWARKTLAKHARDERPHLYTPAELERARTHDPLWNAAQTQLVREGRIHNYLRMLWGKKILEWSASPKDALEVMIDLNNRYALDGRDPGSYSGIFWVLGRYDRPWGPERPVFGTVRYMSSESTARKIRVSAYIRTHGPEGRVPSSVARPLPENRG